MGLLIFLLFFAAAIFAAIDAWRGRSLTALAIALVALAFAVAYWPGAGLHR